MANIKAMFAQISNKENGNSADDGGGDGDRPPAPTSKKTGQNIEKTYQKKSQLEHILLRPDTYIGSVEKITEQMWVYNTETEMMEQKMIQYVPGLYKIFDEILVNAADHKQRDKSMDCIKIEIKPEINTISVWNNGQGIPVVVHKEENMFVPTMIFGHLLTSSNYDDEEEKVTGGRNGYGAKLCNIFSTRFTVETSSKDYRKQFKQTWGDNMTKASDVKVKPSTGEDYTKITFCPDLPKFKMDKLDEGIIGLMSRRAYDVAATVKGVKVFLNGKRVPVKSFQNYVELFLKSRANDEGGTSHMKIAYDNPHERWEVAVAMSNSEFHQISFVNSIATTKGGRHVSYICDMIIKHLTEIIKKKNKGGTKVLNFEIKNRLWIFINCLIVNPTFDSQTKENMTLQVKSFGSKCVLSDKFWLQLKKLEIVDAVLLWAKFKAQNELAKTSGKKKSKLTGIPKLEDANKAGEKRALECTLILTEGDSAKTLAISGMSVVGRDFYGVFPLRGKLLNVREMSDTQIKSNEEIKLLVKILGLDYSKKYNTDDDMKTLRYGKVMIMTDQDQDGSHIKGLLINFFHYKWPELLKRNFLEEFITPIVKARKGKECISFYSMPELMEWKLQTPNYKTYHIKYYKGLGTSDSNEAKEYFRDMKRHRIQFKYNGQEDDDSIVLAFSKKHADHRKEWLLNFMTETRRRKEMGLVERYLYQKGTSTISYADFINYELVLFSNADNIRSIPSMVDGLKPGQRKVIHTCFLRKDKEMKVITLAGAVQDQAAYHHGDMALHMTIVGLAQNFVGSNNINLLEPRGQFGTRLLGGKDSASPRYISTKLSPITRMLFHPKDDSLLVHEYDDNTRIEPTWFIPIIPMVLVNGADGIGTGWMTKIPNFNPRDIVANIRHLLDGEEVVKMTPWYKNFTGVIEDYGDQRYVCNGEIGIISDDTLEITELPVGTWTQNYKENVMEALQQGKDKVKYKIAGYNNYSTDTTVRFIVNLGSDPLDTLEREGLHKVFKLQTMINTTSMCVFDELGCIRRFDHVEDILREYFILRLNYYQKRKDYLEGMLAAEADKLSNQARFILEKCNRELVVENKKRKVIVDELLKRGYLPDPLTEWKQKVKLNADDEEDEDDETPEGGVQEEDESKKKKPIDPEKEFKQLSEVKKFDYLLGMSMWMLTEEKKNELLKKRDGKLAELAELRKKTNSDLWREDLDVFLEKLDQIEKKEREIEAESQRKDMKKTTTKRAKLLDCMPSPQARRVEPTINEEIKKRIQNVIKTKENRVKRATKKEAIEEESDEFDTMVQNKKTLKDKLGVTAENTKLKKTRDGLKQSKLNFNKKSPKENGSPKKRGRKKADANLDDDDEDEDVVAIESGSDVEFSNVVCSPVKERVMSRRMATKPVAYDVFDDDKSMDEDLVLHENAAMQVDKHKVLEAIPNASDSDDDERAPATAPPNVSSEDMFDTLIGRKKDHQTNGSGQSRVDTQSGSDDMSGTTNKASQNTDGDSTDKGKATKKRQKKTDKTIRKKKRQLSDNEDDSEDDVGINTKKKQTKSRAKNVDLDSSDLVESPVVAPKSRTGGRTMKRAKYVFDSDSSN